MGARPQILSKGISSWPEEDRPRQRLLAVPTKLARLQIKSTAAAAEFWIPPSAFPLTHAPLTR